MVYPSLGTYDATPAEDLALLIEFKTLANEGRTTATSPEEFLLGEVVALCQTLAVKHALPEKSPELKAKADAAIANGDAKQTANYVAFMQQNYGVDVTPVIPPDKG